MGPRTIDHDDERSRRMRSIRLDAIASVFILGVRAPAFSVADANDGRSRFSSAIKALNSVDGVQTERGSMWSGHGFSPRLSAAQRSTG